MEPVEVLSRVLDLVETWNIESPFTKSLNRVMQNKFWSDYSQTKPKAVSKNAITKPICTQLRSKDNSQNVTNIDHRTYVPRELFNKGRFNGKKKPEVQEISIIYKLRSTSKMIIDQLYDHVPPPAISLYKNYVKNIKTKPINSCKEVNVYKYDVSLNNFNHNMLNVNVLFTRRHVEGNEILVLIICCIALAIFSFISFL